MVSQSFGRVGPRTSFWFDLNTHPEQRRVWHPVRDPEKQVKLAGLKLSSYTSKNKDKYTGKK